MNSAGIDRRYPRNDPRPDGVRAGIGLRPGSVIMVYQRMNGLSRLFDNLASPDAAEEADQDVQRACAWAASRYHVPLDELVQIVFLAIFNALKKNDPKVAPLRSMDLERKVRAISRNRAIDLIRKATRRREVQHDQLDTVDGQVDRPETEIILAELIVHHARHPPKGVSRPDWSVWCAYHAGSSALGLAAEMRCSARTIRRVIARVRGMLEGGDGLPPESGVFA